MQNYEELKVKSVEKILITPEMAKNLLEKNVTNRRLAPATVKKYAYEMSSGSWMSTHQGIAIDESGQVIDGQHRLSAIVLSGVSILTTLSIYEGDVKTLMIPLDRGKMRTMSDVSGVNKTEIGLYTLFFQLIPQSACMRSNAQTIRELSNRVQDELSYIREITGQSVTNTSAKRTATTALSRIWVAPVKAALLLAVINNENVSDIVDLTNMNPVKKHYKEFYEWYLDSSRLINMGGGSYFGTVAPLFFSCVKNKKFISDTDYDEMDKLRSQMRKIIVKKFPDIFGNY